VSRSAADALLPERARHIDGRLLRRLHSPHSLYWLATYARTSDVRAALVRLGAAGRVVQLNHADADSPMSVWVRAETVARVRAGTRAA
jgi:hypothetical protein